MEDLGKRIYDLRKKRGLTLEEVGQYVGVGRSTVRKWENGIIANMRRDKIKKLSEILNTSPGYIMGWTDDPNCDTDSQLVPPNILPLPSNKAYPLVGDIACGTPILVEENISEYIQFPDDMEVDFCLRCRGDSMVDARIYDGDIVFIRQQPEVENGEIAAVLIGEETTLKRVYRTGDTLTLIAANSAYAPMVYTGAQLENVRILGKAVSFLSAVK